MLLVRSASSWVLGIRAGVLFGHTSCLTTDVMKMVSGWLRAGAQQSTALDQAIGVFAGAAGQGTQPDVHAKVEGQVEDESRKDAKHADASSGQGDASTSAQADESPGKAASAKDGSATLQN